MQRCRLLALDLDGTLLRDDGGVADADRAALDEVRRRGVAVTFATGRLASGTVPLARALGIRLPLVCGDGTATVCPRSADLLAVNPLRPEALACFFQVCDADRSLAPFLFAPEEILASPRAAAMGAMVGWAPRVHAEGALRDAVLAQPAVPVVAAFAIGAEGAVHTAAAIVERRAASAAAINVFPVTGSSAWALRLSPPEVTKAAGLDRLTRGLGWRSDEVAVVGDWYNDIAMFRWAGRSFVMGQAPEPVAREASHRLVATARTGGGVAEAIGEILKII